MLLSLARVQVGGGVLYGLICQALIPCPLADEGVGLNVPPAGGVNEDHWSFLLAVKGFTCFLLLA